MKKNLLFVVMFIFAISGLAADELNGDQGRKIVVIGQTVPPPPHLINLAEPVAMYTISTATVDFTFDANYYSEYTIHLVGEYVEMDYFVYTPVVYIPVATFGEIVDIYIESEDCGSYYGVLDKTAFTSME